MASKLSFWFGPKILCRAGINPDSPAPADTYANAKMRKTMIAVLKESRNSIDSCMLDLIAADDYVDFQVFVMLHTNENYLRDVPSDIPDDDITNEVDSDALNGMEEEVLDESFGVVLAGCPYYD
ncbi:hypothetical protein BHE90_006177 [Fusarium euwallaceae]|uniref:Uncharacterized protein n=1 Tax=Fusarium euwallaceae TaxID=1147111 RepID=A0A430LUF1_9HYPO|nr:hypothetical protein BHE90_006177 [Fusarium euwallaceae]